jgi:hypothetical protein
MCVIEILRRNLDPFAALLLVDQLAVGLPNGCFTFAQSTNSSADPLISGSHPNRPIEGFSRALDGPQLLPERKMLALLVI